MTYSKMRNLSLLLFSLALLLAACGAEEATPPEEEEAVTETEEMGGPADVVAIPPRADDPSRASPNARAEQDIGPATVTITYGSPGVKGRQIYGGLVPYGQVWRAGANEATVFHTTQDVTINGEALPAGAYGFFAIPGEDEWTLVFNTVAEQWGAFDYDASQDALRVAATPEGGSQQEQLTYLFENTTGTSANAVLHWDTVRVPFTIAVQ